SGGQPSFANGTFAPEGVWSDLWDGDYPTNGIWQLLAIDDQQGFNGTILDWTITFEPLYQVFYEWTPADGLSCTDCPNPIATPSQTTTYTVTASDTYGCTVQDSITITVKDVLDAPNVNCTDVTNNSITFTWPPVAGATMGYMVSLNGGPNVLTFNTSEALTGLALDTEVTIEVFAVGECDGLVGTATCSTPPCTAPNLMISSISGVSCNGGTNGSVTLLASGGAGDYTYTFNGVDNTTGVFSNIAEGTYTASVVDSWNCPNTLQVVVPAPQALDIQPIVTTPVSCNGFSDAELSAPTTGGNGAYSYVWSNGQTGMAATNFAAGTHTVTVTDANGCTANASITLDEPVLLTLSTAVDDATCFGQATGSAQVLIAGGTADYDINWDAAAGNASTATVNNLGAGNYAVTVTDANGCTASAAAVVGEPSQLTAAVDPTDPACNGASTGTATATANGGTTGYTFAWSNGDTGPSADQLPAGNHSVTVTDAQGCTATATTTLVNPPGINLQLTPVAAACFGENSGSVAAAASGGTSPLTYLWNNGATSPNLPNLTAGQYCLTVTDAGGCTSTACATVAQPSNLALNLDPTNANCNGVNSGEIDLSISGGVGPYQHTWSNGSTDEDLTGLAADAYEVTVTDANGCTEIAQAELVDNAALACVFENELVKCKEEATGSARALPSGGELPYGYLWSTGLTGSSINNVTAGDYLLTVTDANGCSAVFDTQVEEPTDSLKGVLELDYVSCYGERDGRIAVIAVGGTGPYQYSLDSAQFNGATVYNNLDFGLYDLVIRDANGCLWEQKQIYIGEPKELRVSLGPDTTLNYGTTLLLNPAISNLTNPSGAVFHWFSNNPQMQAVDTTSRVGEFLVISPTSVTFTVVDENGCTAEDLINIFVRANRDVLVPTGFAPSAGGNLLNDHLHVHGNSEMVKEITLFRVFDRWGELVYQATNFGINAADIGWDGNFKGKEMPAGVYAWYLEVEYVDGEKAKYRGESTLVR
ncbi:MAG: gliding motility-associated C-terminal domain-containing protein, partial [Saprospiraceae bacterium]|nr:gliding motility-associated C-terminal domain-containing protein [Saprospiraceae bacterium]